MQPFVNDGGTCYYSWDLDMVTFLMERSLGWLWRRVLRTLPGRCLWLWYSYYCWWSLPSGWCYRFWSLWTTIFTSEGAGLDFWHQEIEYYCWVTTSCCLLCLLSWFIILVQLLFSSLHVFSIFIPTFRRLHLLCPDSEIIGTWHSWKSWAWLIFFASSFGWPRFVYSHCYCCLSTQLFSVYKLSFSWSDCVSIPQYSFLFC